MRGAKQYYALGFGVFVLPAVYVLPKMGWLWAAMAGILGGGFLGAMICLHRRDPRPLAAVAGKSPWGKCLLGLTLLWNLGAIGMGVRMLESIYPTGKGGPLLGLLLLLLAVYAGEQGGTVLSRVGAVLFLFLGVFFGIIFAFGLPQIHGQWLEPVKKIPWALFPALLAPVPLFYLCGEEKSNPLPWLAGGIALVVAGAVFCAGSLSPRVVVEEAFPFYTAVKSVSVLGVMERMEALVSAALTAGAFALMGMVCAVNGKIMKQFFPKERVFTPAVNFFLGGGAYWLAPRLPDWVKAGGTTIFWGLIPLGILLVGNTKKFEKNEKNS